MRFGEKLKEQRERKKLSQIDLAAEIGVSRRTLINYESGASYPKDRATYFKLAEILDVDVNYLLTENEEFLRQAADRYGKKGLSKAEAILEQTAALFAGGELSEQDQIAFLHEMQALFFDSKEREKERFTSKKKYRKPKKSPEA